MLDVDLIFNNVFISEIFELFVKDRNWSFCEIYTIFAVRAIVLPGCVESYLISVLGIRADVRG